MALTLGFFGAGTQAQPYLDALGRRSDVAVTAVCDPDRRAAEHVASGWGARVFDTPEGLLDTAQPDALFLCVAPHLQNDALLQAAERGVPFLVEVPGAVDYERGRLFAQRVEAGRLVTAVGFTGRLADTLLEARAYLAGSLPPLLHGWWLHSSPDAPAGPALLWGEACRLVDAMRFFGGEVAHVHTVPAGPDGAGLAVQLAFTGGSAGLLACARFARPEMRVELELHGQGWSISFGEDFRTLWLAERDKSTLLRRLNDPVTELTNAFLEAVQSGDRSAVPTAYPEALATMAVCQAALVSATEGRSVRLEEVTGG